MYINYVLPSFPSALQLRVSFDLLNSLLPFFPILHQLGLHIFLVVLEADYLVSQQFNFYGVRSSASRPTPNFEDQGIPLRLAPTP
jgi:hypothetical protein